MANGLTNPMPELTAVSLKSPVGSNSTTPNCKFPAFCKADAATERVVPVMDKPDPKVISAAVDEADEEPLS
jgi:hypothetical protein